MANGVPPLLNPPPAAPADAPMTADEITTGVGDAAWGLFINGEEILKPDSIATLDYRNDSRIANYPQEKGAFGSYNKVASPFDIRVRMTKGGTEADRKAFLDSLDVHANSLELIDVVMPERTYMRTNIVHVDLHRSASKGAGMLTVDVGLEEVREIATSVFTSSGAQPVTSSANPAANDPQHAGTVQPLNVDPKFQADLLAGLRAVSPLNLPNVGGHTVLPGH